MFVKPDFARRFAVGEKQQIGFDAGVRVEHVVGQTNDRVQVAFGQELFLDP